ncbi:MAG: succinate dehydrogenase [Oscillospiraceae bacterium]|nr:succinate dehydrogenase [Oscillospiraceae bacterium]
MITLKLEILRRTSPEDTPVWKCYDYQTPDDTANIASALNDLNQTLENPVRWECSCLQKKCGACAMLINQKPRLACDTSLKEFVKAGTVRIEPLRKFPVIADLIVDRTILFENLKTMKLWFAENAKTNGSQTAYEASRCLQCGCCLEICPNFYAGGDFAGMSAMTLTARLLTALPEAQKKEIFKAYQKHIYEGCGKSLACRKICPAGIEIDQLLVNSNAVAVWKRKFRHEK